MPSYSLSPLLDCTQCLVHSWMPRTWLHKSRAFNSEHIPWAINATITILRFGNCHLEGLRDLPKAWNLSGADYGSIVRIFPTLHSQFYPTIPPRLFPSLTILLFMSLLSSCQFLQPGSEFLMEVPPLLGFPWYPECLAAPSQSQGTSILVNRSVMNEGFEPRPIWLKPHSITSALCRIPCDRILVNVDGIGFQPKVIMTGGSRYVHLRKCQKYIQCRYKHMPRSARWTILWSAGQLGIGMSREPGVLGGMGKWWGWGLPFG